MKKILTGITALVVIFCLGLAGNDYYELHKPGLIVLLYHGVTQEKAHVSKYSMNVETFSQQMAELKKLGYDTILPRDLPENENSDNTSKKIVLSFDDGTPGHYRYVFPVLQNNRLKGLFFVVTSSIGTSWGLTANQIADMSQNGMEFGSHSHTHPFLDELPPEKIRMELAESKEILSRITGQKITAFAPPGGWYDSRSLAIARNLDYEAFFGCEIGTNDLAKRPFIYKRIEVLGDMSLEEFHNLLNPPSIFGYKYLQSMKFLLHDLIGSRMYRKLATLP